MKASELITALQAMIEEHGDLPVKFTDNFGDNLPAMVEVITVDFVGKPEAFIHLSDY